jgi:hypothetical protein
MIQNGYATESRISQIYKLVIQKIKESIGI